MNEIFSLQQIDIIAQNILTTFSTYNKFSFYGNLGAGKTTLISAMCKQLGVTDYVSSPTFAIIQEYQGVFNNHSITICHTDWYRLKSVYDLETSGVLDYLQNPEVFCFIEWPNNIPEAINETVLKLQLSTIDEQTRQIKTI